jgi:hypothetical protein
MPDGEMPGTQTKYDDFITNNVRFVTGYSYLMPPALKKDLERRIRMHEIQFQNLSKERKNLMVTGDPRTESYRGYDLNAQEAIARQAQGIAPQDVAKHVAPAGDLR